MDGGFRSAAGDKPLLLERMLIAEGGRARSQMGASRLSAKVEKSGGSEMPR